MKQEVLLLKEAPLKHRGPTLLQSCQIWGG